MNVTTLFINRTYKTKKLWNKENNKDGENEKSILNKCSFRMPICMIHCPGTRLSLGIFGIFIEGKTKILRSWPICFIYARSGLSKWQLLFRKREFDLVFLLSPISRMQQIYLRAKILWQTVIWKSERVTRLCPSVPSFFLCVFFLILISITVI